MQNKIRQRDIIKYETRTMEKRDFIINLCSILEENGWTKLNSKYTTEGLVYHSKGEKGKSDIYINFYDGYDFSTSASYTFSKNANYFDIRTMIDYKPSDIAGAQGVSVPALSTAQYVLLYMGAYSSNAPDTKYTIRYNCNKDRLIMLITTDVQTSFFMIGRPSNNYAKDYQKTGNLFIGSIGYQYQSRKIYPCVTYGIADRPTKEATRLNMYYAPSGKSFYNGNVNIAELGFGNEVEGIKGFVEGVYYAPRDIDKANNNTMDGDKFVDEIGNEFVILFTGLANTTHYSNLLPEGYLVVCTKLAGEE